MAGLEASNCEEYILARFALCGELPSVGIGIGIPYSNTYVVDTIRKMRKKDLIHEFRYNDRKKYYRISNPKGMEAIRKRYGSTATSHLELMLGDSSSRYKGTSDYRMKQRKLYELCFFFNSVGFDVDRIHIAKESNDFGSKKDHKSLRRISVTEKEKGVFSRRGTLKSIPQIFSEYDSAAPTFLTSKALRNLADTGIQLHPRTQMYRASGMMISGKNIFSVYYLRGSGEMWWKDVEGQYAFQMWRMAANHLQTVKGTSFNAGLRKAIFFFPDRETVTDFITNRTKRVKINPGDVYNMTYAVPLKENAAAIIKMLSIDNWRNKLNRVLSITPSTSTEVEDGFMESGTGMFNFLCCNIRRMKLMAERIKATNAVVLIHDWQQEIAHELYGKKVNAIVIDEAMFDVLVRAVANQE